MICQTKKVVKAHMIEIGFFISKKQKNINLIKYRLNLLIIEDRKVAKRKC